MFSNLPRQNRTVRKLPAADLVRWAAGEWQRVHSFRAMPQDRSW